MKIRKISILINGEAVKGKKRKLTPSVLLNMLSVFMCFCILKNNGYNSPPNYQPQSQRAKP